MTGFDILLAAIIIGSALLAFIHGIIKEIFTLVAWVVGLAAAILFAGVVGSWFPVNFLGEPHLRFLVAFLLILVVVLVLGAVIGSALKSGAKAIGLGFLDRLLGGVFGVIRGVLIAMIIVLVFASTEMAREPWFAKSQLVPRLIVGAVVVRQSLPPDWAHYLDGMLHPAPVVPAAPPAAAPAAPQRKT